MGLATIDPHSQKENTKIHKIGPQCELVWDFSQIKVDVLSINMTNCSFTVNTGAHYFLYMHFVVL